MLTILNIMLKMCRNLLLMIVMCFLVTGVVYSKKIIGVDSIGSVRMGKITANIVMSVEGENLHATLKVINNTSKPVYLEKSKIFFDGDLENHLFRLFSNGQKVRYIGISAKIGELQANDFIMLTPGQHHVGTIDLSNSYKFLDGKNKYEGYYKAYHSLFGQEDFWKLQSNTVKFTFPG